jgi:cell division protein FtsW
MRITNSVGYPQLLLACGGLSFLGALPLIQALATRASGDRSLSLAFPFLVSFGLGILAFLAVMRLDLRSFFERSPLLLVPSIAVLALSAIPAWKESHLLNQGVTPLNDAFFKTVLAVYIAGLLSSRKGTLKNLRTWYRILLYLAPAMVLMLVRPAPGEAIMLAGLLVAGLYLAGARTSLVYGLSAAAAALFAVLLVTDGTAFAMFKPWKTSTALLYASIYAPSSYEAGGLWGSPGSDLHMPLLLNTPEYSSFMLPALSERFGAFCVLAALLLIEAALLTGLHIAAAARRTYHGMLAGLISFSLALAALINLASTVGLLPPVGVPFPFLNIYSPTFAWCCLGAGVLFNIACAVEREKPALSLSDTAVFTTCELPATRSVELPDTCDLPLLEELEALGRVVRS